MTFRALRTTLDNALARDELARGNLAYWPRLSRQRLRDRVLGRAPLVVGDPERSWDLLATLQLLRERGDHAGRVVDLRACGSELLCTLHQAGFRDLLGIDESRDVVRMPYRHAIHWRLGDATRTALRDGSVTAAVALGTSLLRGDLEPWLCEAARMLRSNGVLVGSTPYWPEGSGRIAGKPDVARLIDAAERFGLRPQGPLDFAVEDPCFRTGGSPHTVGWFALVKTA